MPSGNKPLPEQMVTQVYIAIWHHWAQWVKAMAQQYHYFFIWFTEIEWRCLKHKLTNWGPFYLWFSMEMQIQWKCHFTLLEILKAVWCKILKMTWQRYSWHKKCIWVFLHLISSKENANIKVRRAPAEVYQFWHYCNYMFMFPLTNLACKGLKSE